MPTICFSLIWKSDGTPLFLGRPVGSGGHLDKPSGPDDLTGHPFDVVFGHGLHGPYEVVDMPVAQPVELVKGHVHGLAPVGLESDMEISHKVFVGGCHIGDCHYISGNEKAYRRIVKTKKLLEELGIDPRRFRLEWVSASEGKIFQKVITEFVNQLKELGPSELRPKIKT